MLADKNLIVDRLLSFFDAFGLQKQSHFSSSFSILFQKQHNHLQGSWINMITLFFGLVHGFGFGRYFKMIASEGEAILGLLEFALGVEFAQIFIVIFVLLINWLVITFLKIQSLKWKWVVASMVLSQALLMTSNNWPF